MGGTERDATYDIFLARAGESNGHGMEGVPSQKCFMEGLGKEKHTWRARHQPLARDAVQDKLHITMNKQISSKRLPRSELEI